MLQQDYLFPGRTIWDNDCIGLELIGRLNEESKIKVARLLEEMGLEGTEKRYPQQLSGGMRQWVALVRTLACEPELLLLDEPFSALDYQTKLQLEDLVWSTPHARGIREVETNYVKVVRVFGGKSGTCSAKCFFRLLSERSIPR